MIVYCAGAIKGDITYQKYYKEIIFFVKSNGHVAISELNQEIKGSDVVTDPQIYERDLRWLDESDIMIAEVSGPSLGVGYEVAYALHVRKIPVLTLLNSNVERISSMIAGCTSDILYFKTYSNSDELKAHIKGFMQKHLKK